MHVDTNDTFSLYECELLCSLVTYRVSRQERRGVAASRERPQPDGQSGNFGRSRISTPFATRRNLPRACLEAARIEGEPFV